MTGTYDFEDLNFEIGEDHVATIEIQRPPNNYFDTLLVASLADANCRTLLFVSKGKNFCAGARLAPAAPSAGALVPKIEGGRHLYEHAVRLCSTRKVVVAAIQGAAASGGLCLALMAERRLPRFRRN